MERLVFHRSGDWRFRKHPGCQSRYGDSHPATIDCGDFFGKRDEALKTHKTQIDPVGFFFAVSSDFQRTVWPWEDYTLIQSKVESELPEKDLFAGIR